MATRGAYYSTNWRRILLAVSRADEALGRLPPGQLNIRDIIRVARKLARA